MPQSRSLRRSLDWPIRYFKSDESWQQFVDQWSWNEDCSLSKWARRQGDITMAEARRRFRYLIRRDANLARDMHYVIGWAINSKERLQLTMAAANNPEIAFQMWKTDRTLTDYEDEILERSMSSSLNYKRELSEGPIVRAKQGEPLIANEDSQNWQYFLKINNLNGETNNVN